MTDQPADDLTLDSPTARAAVHLADAWTPALNIAQAIGWELGYWAGYNACEREMADDWHALYLDVQARRRQPSAAELEQRRSVTHEPCPQRCEFCAQCVHAAAWRRNGRQPFTGGTVAWAEPQEPAA